MGTNFYSLGDACPCCGRGGEERHIGKSSMGWCFALHVYPDDGISTLADWLPIFEAHPIKDEYGAAIPAEQMVERITRRTHGGTHAPDAAWYRENHAEPGPNGLARSRVDGHSCIGHGDGTYDYHVGDFS